MLYSSKKFILKYDSVHIIILYENLGANLLYISFFVALTRAIEIIFKPTIAIISDRCRSKLGRRKPFIYFGCGFYAIFFIMLFYPPIDPEKNFFIQFFSGKSEEINLISASSKYIINQFMAIETTTVAKPEVTNSFFISIWFGIFYILFFIADTICNIPYGALAPELSTNPKKREQLFFMYYLTQYIGVLFAVSGPVLMGYFYFNTCDFSSCQGLEASQNSRCVNHQQQICNSVNNLSSIRTVAYIISILYVFNIIQLGIFIKEKYSVTENEADQVQVYEHKYIIPSINNMMENKAFISLIPPYILDNIILALFATMIPFYLKYVINPEEYCHTTGENMNSIFCNTNLL